MLVSCQFLLMNEAAAEELTVTPSMSIQEVIDNAAKGDTIYIKKGQYHGNLVINKSIILKGEAGALISGSGEGNTIEINAPNVTIENLMIEKSGKKDTNAVIWVESSNNIIQNNVLKDVHFGIYVNKGSNNQIVNNQIIGYRGHFATKGNGIHLFYAEDTSLIGNKIYDTQDGVYFDFAKRSTLKNNEVSHVRYGYHVMYAKEGLIENNISSENITGAMIMDAADFRFIDNVITKNLNYRGHGVLIFDSDRIEITNNNVTYNNTGLSLQDARDCKIENNLFAGNYIGLDLKDKNERNTMVHNNFIGNIVQTKIFTKVEPMDINEQGNYWDDYSGLDLDGDGIGEIPYESGKLFDKLVEENPTLQFFFESPTIKLWSSIERIFPAFSSDKGMDRYPLTRPVEGSVILKENETVERNFVAALLGIVMIAFSLLTFYRGRVLR